MKKHSFYYALILFALILTSCSSGEKKNIFLNLEKGKIYKLETKSEQTITQTIMGFNNEMKTEIEADIEYTVADISPDKVYTLSSKFEGMKIKMDAAMMKINSEDSTGLNKIMHDAMAAFKGFSFSMKVTQAGKVKEISGADSLLCYLGQRMMTSDSVKGKDLNETWSKYFNKNSLGANFENIFAYFPHQAVGEGDSWEKAYENSTIFPMKINSKFKLKKLTAEYAVIKSDATIETSSSPVMEMGGMKMKYKIKGEQESTIKVDINTGWIIESETIGKIKGEMAMDMGKLGNKSGMNISIPIKIEMKTSAKAIK